MASTAVYIVAIITFLITSASSGAARYRIVNPDTITVYVPAFFSEPAPLGLNVSTVLGLQIWQTLRQRPPSTGRTGGDDFGEGIVRWTPRTLSAFGHQAAEMDAQRGDILAQLVLSGKAYRFGDGVVVFAELSLPRYFDFRIKVLELWTVAIKTPSGVTSEITADLPSRHYSFDPIVLRADLIRQFSRPDALTVYKDPRGRNPKGSLPPNFKAVTQSANAVRVKAGKLSGWVLLPGLGAERSEITEFVGGLFRLFRGDWAGARELLGRVVSIDAASISLKLDAHLLRAYASARLGLDADAELQEAERLNTASARVVVYRAMERFERIARAPNKDRPELAVSLRDFLMLNRAFFDQANPWFENSVRLLDELIKG